MVFGEYFAVKTIQVGSRTIKKAFNRVTDDYPRMFIHAVDKLLGEDDLPPVTEKEKLLQNRSIPIARMVDVVYDIANKKHVEHYSRPIAPEELFPAPNHVDPAISKLLKCSRSLVRVFRLSADEIVVAVRGTRITSLEDLMGDTKIALECLHYSKRVEIVESLVEMIIEQYPTVEVILAGHSLGAAIAFHAGRKLYLKGVKLEGHFFELPFMPLDTVVEELLTAFQAELYVAKKCAAVLQLNPRIEEFQGWLKQLPDNPESTKLDAEFDKLEEWQPHIYVQKYDKISNGYINYFMNTSLDTPGRNVSRFTPIADVMMRDLNARGYHLCPSAILITSDAGVDTLTSHGIKNWTYDSKIWIYGYKNWSHRIKVVEYSGLCKRGTIE